MQAPSPLTARFCQSVTKPGRYGDGRGGYGLCLNVKGMANGRTARSWVQRIRPGGRPTYIGLGTFPIVTLAEARKLALANATMIAKGTDPRTGGVPTFAVALDRVLEVQRGAWRDGGKSEKQWRASLRAYAPSLMQKPVDAIQSADVLKVLAPIWNGKRETARRVRQRISKVMQWTIAEGHCVANPVDSIGAVLPSNGNRKEHFRALPYDQVASALATIEATSAWWATKAALTFAVLTAARSGEVRGMTWDEVEGDVWTVPAERMKAGREHRVPLSDAAMAVLVDARKLTDGKGLVFPSTVGRSMSDSATSKLLRESGIDGTPHGMRSAFRDWASERTNAAHAVMEAALAHTIANKAEAAYARSDLFDKRRVLMEGWARYLSPSAAKVVNLR